MDIKKVESLMKLMRKHQIYEVSIDDHELGGKVKLTSMAGAPAPTFAAAVPAPTVAAPAAVESSPVSGERESSGDIKLKSGQALVRSPFVGTYYESSSPGGDPFVKVGQKVHKGDVLCIVEAMKLMNEIETESDGVIAEIFGKNGQPVEFDQPLFVIE